MKRIKSFLIVLYLNNLILAGIIGYFAYSMANNFTDDTKLFYSILLPVLAVWGIAFAVLTIANFIFALKLFNREYLDLLDKAVRLMKLAAIPFFILNFILLGAITTLFVAVSHGMGIFFIPVPFVLTYCIVMVTSFYSIPYILLLWKNNKIGNTMFLIIFILQFFFVLDIISIIYLLKVSKIRFDS